MKKNILNLLLLIAIFSSSKLIAQKSYRALFLGNSYTSYNNLPQIVADAALSAGDTLIFESNSPGGYRLLDHATNTLSLNKLQAGGWDYVILQEQSRTPILSAIQFRQGGGMLNNNIIQNNPCSETILYMTWGRKNGDASNCPTTPTMCTYEGMDSSLRSAYLDLAAELNAEVSPVSVVWNHLRQNNPGIELYNVDESHPSLAGSYAAACSFYVTLFKKNPNLITFNGGLNPADAAIIRNVAKIKVFDNLSLWDYKQQTLPESKIEYYVTSGLSGVNEVFFVTPDKAERYFWDLGDGTTSTESSFLHSYLSDGTYTVSLKTSNCSLAGLDSSLVTDTIIQFCSHTPTVSKPSPWCWQDTISTQLADAYQWFINGQEVPETNQFLIHTNPNGRNFKVATTVNGCTEMSENASRYSHSYSFDLNYYGNDSCVGDTVQFTVSTSTPLLGFPIIEWYKDGVLLPSIANEDTILITTEGTYECRILNSNSSCLMDTIFSGLITLDCETISIEKVAQTQNLLWSLYPNPASETITIKFIRNITSELVQIYNIMGHLVTEKIATERTSKLNIEDLPNGIYFIRLKNSPQRILKFIKSN
jgi:hypothetical protein